MSGIREHIRDQVLARRLGDKRCLVVYDPERRYREVVEGMKAKGREVLLVDGSLIATREEAMRALQALGRSELNELVVWTPAAPPVPTHDADYQQDPFAVLARVGAQFPAGDGDSFHSICRKAKPDHLPEIDRLFANGQVPSFEMIDALDQGGSWPRLKTLLKVESAKEVLVALLAPSEAQVESLGKDDLWVEEARDFVGRTLGHTFQTKGKTWNSIGEELWKVVLFSEFAFDQRADLPEALSTVPCAGAEARDLIYDVCDTLRKHSDHQEPYKKRALEIEAKLALAQHAEALENLGKRDTFPCEERRYLQLLTEKAKAGDLDGARAIMEERRNSLWSKHEERLADWELAAAALDLLEAAGELGREAYPDLHAQILGYATRDKELDRKQRVLEQAAHAWMGGQPGLHDLVQRAREAYSKAVGALQEQFMTHVVEQGWPAVGQGMLANAQLFNQRVAPALEAGERVAYILVDSLRYELGVELEKALSEQHQVTLEPVCAQLPTYTEVGMASLMPDADRQLRIAHHQGGLRATLGEEPATNPAERFAHLKRTKGDQCQDVELDAVLKDKKLKVDPQVKLLVVRTRDIDTLAHQTPHQIHGLIPELLRQVIRGVARLGELGFQRAIIATDHGFMLFHEQQAGDVASRPKGKWLVEKSRCSLGKGEEDATNVVFPVERMGIPCDEPNYAVPRTLVPYKRSEPYFHEGLSLQECVLPCLSVALKAPEPKRTGGKQDITISFKQGKTDKVTTRRPVIDLAWTVAELFEQEPVELTLVALDAKGNEVGRPTSGPTLNPATGGVRLAPGQAVHVGLAMADDFRGNFKVRVQDPATGVLLAEINLKTDYLE